MTISSVIDAHLLRDREDPATCNLSLKDICDRKKDIYGLPGTAVRRKVQNQDNYLKGVKKNDPSKYWQLVADARVKVKHPVSPTSAITDDEYEEEDDEDIPVASVVSVKPRTKPTKQSKRSSVKPSKRSPVKQPIKKPTISRTPPKRMAARSILRRNGNANAEMEFASMEAALEYCE